jgi:transposase
VVFPHLGGVRIDRVDRSVAGLWIWCRAVAVMAECRACGAASSRVHGRYQRRLDDLAVGGEPVVIWLTVRRFLCRNAVCDQRTFVEQIPGLTWRYGRRSRVLQRALEAIGLALAGRAGSRLAQVLSLKVSRSTLLRLVRALPEQTRAVPAVLGIDDFALRRGKIYGTVLVDMVARRPIDVLAGREARVVADWLAAHPGVEIICRDRAPAYAQGALAGAPAAVQVADRWHVWQNLIEAVEKCVIQHQSCLREPAAPDQRPRSDRPEPVSATLEMETQTRLIARIRGRYAAVQQMVAAGHGYRPTARILRLSLGTVKRYARAADVEELLTSAARPSNLDAFKPYLHERWNAGHTRPIRLFEEIHALGYTGSYHNVRDYIRRLHRWTHASATIPSPPSVRNVVGWIVQRPGRLDPHDHEQFQAILDRCPELNALAAHVRQFAIMMTGRHGERLPGWLAQAAAIDLAGLRSFVKGIQHDQDAVAAGLTLPWNSGPVEGHVNRIKMLKRQMFGRANIDLLRKRVLMTS